MPVLSLMAWTPEQDSSTWTQDSRTLLPNAIQAGQWIDLPGIRGTSGPRDRNQPGTGISQYWGHLRTEVPDSAKTGGTSGSRG